MENKEPPEESVRFTIYLLDERGIAQTSLTTYLKYYIMLTKMYPNEKDRDGLTQAQVKVFVIKHKNNFAVRGFMKAYIQFKEIDIPLPPRMTGKKGQKIIRNINPEEIKMIRDYLYKKDYQSGLMFDIITQGALRLSEVITLKVNSFNWIEWKKEPSNYGKLHIMGKGKKERNVLIEPDTMENILNKITDRSPNEKVEFFANRNDLLFDNLYPMKVYNLIKKASKKVIGIDIRPHELRHSRATNLLKSGNSILDIKSLLGHSSVATTEIYLHTSEEESLKNLEKNMKKEAL